MTCGVAIWRNERTETCGAKARHVLLVNGDYLIPVCERHTKRLEKAFPGLRP